MLKFLRNILLRERLQPYFHLSLNHDLTEKRLHLISQSSISPIRIYRMTKTINILITKYLLHFDGLVHEYGVPAIWFAIIVVSQITIICLSLISVQSSRFQRSLIQVTKFQ